MKRCRVLRMTEEEYRDLLIVLGDARERSLHELVSSAPSETPAGLERASTALSRGRERARRIESDAQIMVAQAPPLASYHRGRASAAAELLEALRIGR